ncbi:hypothetical protein ACIRCZ_20330 [Leifsonia sp. NPDC102414]|uniref:hypothetical protein n=1 Tax=Leifsonia sp. NPDC102414 TaxID=3364124 RepID=UPI00382A4CBF
MSLDSRVLAPEISSMRLVGLMDVGLVLIAALLSISVGAAVSILFDAPEVAAIGRNTSFLVGLMLCARAMVGAPAVMAPTAWVLAVLFIGFRSPYNPYYWTVLPESVAAIHASIIAVLVFIAGIIASLCTSRSHP